MRRGGALGSNGCFNLKLGARLMRNLELEEAYQWRWKFLRRRRKEEEEWLGEELSGERKGF